MRTLSCLICIFAVWLFDPGIQADPAPESAHALDWILDPTKRISVDSADAGSAPDFYTRMHTLRLPLSNGTQMSFSCQIVEDRPDSPVRLNVMFDMQPDKDTARPTMQLRRLTVRLDIDGKAKNERWVWNALTMKIVRQDRSIPRRLYNAAVRGSHVRLRVFREWRFDFVMPPINDDFRDFVKVCPPGFTIKEESGRTALSRGDRHNRYALTTAAGISLIRITEHEFLMQERGFIIDRGAK